MTTSKRTSILYTVRLVVLSVFAIGLLSAQVAVAASDDPEPSLRPDAPLTEMPRLEGLFGDGLRFPSGGPLPILAVPSGEGEPLLRTSVLAIEGVGTTPDWFQTNGVSLAPEGRQAPGQRPVLTGQYGTDGVILMSIGI